MGRLDGKVALVTGSGRNIGRATVLKLAGEGAHVVVNARSNEAEADAVAREARDRGVKALAVIADVARKDQVTAMVARAISEFAAHNIRANVVSPGSTDTRRDNPEWYRGHVPSAAGIPLGRQGHVDEIAATCLFLVSDDGGFITGQTIHVNGGTGYY